MNRERIYKKIEEHHKAASIAVFLVSFTVYIAIPDGVSLLDLSTKNSQSAVINHAGALLNIIDWEYSTHINETDGVASFDKMYGLPDILILDPGQHTLNVSCSWRIYNMGWIDSDSSIQVDIEPGTVYKLISKRVQIPLARDKCVVELLKYSPPSTPHASDIQSRYLEKYGFYIVKR